MQDQGKFAIANRNEKCGRGFVLSCSAIDGRPKVSWGGHCIHRWHQFVLYGRRPTASEHAHCTGITANVFGKHWPYLMPLISSGKNATIFIIAVIACQSSVSQRDESAAKCRTKLAANEIVSFVGRIKFDWKSKIPAFDSAFSQRLGFGHHQTAIPENVVKYPLWLKFRVVVNQMPNCKKKRSAVKVTSWRCYRATRDQQHVAANAHPHRIEFCRLRLVHSVWRLEFGFLYLIRAGQTESKHPYYYSSHFRVRGQPQFQAQWQGLNQVLEFRENLAPTNQLSFHNYKSLQQSRNIEGAVSDLGRPWPMFGINRQKWIARNMCWMQKSI